MYVHSTAVQNGLIGREQLLRVGHNKLKKKNLGIRIGCALALGFVPPFWGISQAAEIGQSVTVEENTVKETAADASGQITNSLFDTTYTNVDIKQGGRWRPMDSSRINGPFDYNTRINIDTLRVEPGGIIDLSWNEKASINGSSRSIGAKNVTLGDGAVFRIRGEAATYDATMLTNTPSVNAIEFGSYDQKVNGSGTLQIQLGKIGNFDPVKINRNSTAFGDVAGLMFMTLYEKDSNQFKVQGQGAYMDAPLYVYKVTPIINSKEDVLTRLEVDPVTGEYKTVIDGYLLYASLQDYSFDNTKLLSESAKTAGDMQLGMRNLWRMENTNAFHRLDELHGANQNQEGFWANTYSGKFTNNGSYGRSIRENYHGQQVGYDKQRAGDFYHGKLYTGVFLQETRADVGVEKGSGNSESKGFGTYATWVGNNGHYVDLLLRGSKLYNNYYFYNNSEKVDANNSAWAFGLNTRYGIHKPLSNGWFLEPQVGMAIGKIDDGSYTTSNGLEVMQHKVNVFTGQLGVLVGRTIGEKDGKVYAKATINHDFSHGGFMEGRYSDGTQSIETASNRDTWCELVVGADGKISPTGKFNISLLHTFGGDVKTNWQVKGGFDWRWNGFGSKVASTTEKNKMLDTAGSRQGEQKLQSVAPMNPQSTPEAVINIAEKMQPMDTVRAQQTSTTTSSPAHNNVNLAVEQDDSASYNLEPILVQASRPAWEEKLSPGTVTVIEPGKYKGEQKSLPDLLREVPGVHVRNVNGIGQYTTVSVRGSTASQVGVFVDGVLTNLGGDAAVDISTIPIKNVARIEVYRGYIPARFSGTYIGGVINIVTQKPEKTDISASYGQRSWGGYTGSLQIDTPLHDGTLMVGVNREQSEGDFPYKNSEYDKNIGSAIADMQRGVKSVEERIANGEIPPDSEEYVIAKRWLAYYENLSGKRYRMNNSYKNTDVLVKWQNEHWMAKVSWKQNHRLMANRVADWSTSDVPDTSALLYDSTSARFNPRREQDITATDVLVGRRDTSGNLEWGWNVNYLKQGKEYRNPDLRGYLAEKPLAVWSKYDSTRWGVGLDGGFKAGNHLLDFLLSVSQETMDIDGSKMDSLGVTSSHQWKNKYKQTLFNVQLQDTMTLNDAGNLWFTPAIRYNSSDVLGTAKCIDLYHRWLHIDEGQKDGQTTWQLALKKKVNDHLTLRSSYGKYYRLLNLYEIAGDGASILPRPNINWGPASESVYPRPEGGMQWDLGAHWQGKALNAKSDISLTYFSRRSENLLQLLRYGLDYWCYDNSAKGTASGVELQSNLNWNKWDLNLNATHVKATRSVIGNNPTGYGKWLSFPMTYTPEWEGKLRLTYRPNNNTALFTEVNYTGKQYVEEISGQDRKVQTDLTTIGVGCRYKMSENAQLVFGVNDLFDKGPYMKKIAYFAEVDGSKRETPIEYPQQGRTYYATLQYDL